MNKTIENWKVRILRMRWTGTCRIEIVALRIHRWPTIVVIVFDVDPSTIRIGAFYCFETSVSG
jgi:hypothetical protein